MTQQERKSFAERFFREERGVLSDYAQLLGLRVVPGDEWSFDRESGKITFNLEEFEESGLTPFRAMIPTLHELEELREFRRDPSLYRRELGRFKRTGYRLQLLHGSLGDILVYKTVAQRAPLYQGAIKTRYQEVLFPELDYTSYPQHLQFAFAILREAMVPKETLIVDPKVREAVEKLKDFQDKDLIKLIGQPGVEPPLRVEAIRRFIEPIYEELFQEDVAQGKKAGLSGAGEGEGNEVEIEISGISLSDDEKLFAQDYQKANKILSHLLPREELEKIIGEFEKKVSRRAGPEDLDRRAYELEHGVTWEDIQAYYREYQRIEPYIEDLKKVFEKIINRRIELKRRLKARGKEGAVLDPGLLTQAKLDAQAGIPDSPVWLNYEKRPVEVIAPGGFEVTLVCDLSGSMEGPIEKLIEERRCTILFLEALKDFHQLAEVHRQEMVELTVKSEVRGFGDFEEELKPLSSKLNETQRIEVFKNLAHAPGQATWDYESLTAIREGIDQEKQKRIAKGELKKCVVVFSDGYSSNATRVQGELEQLRKMGVTVVGVGITQYAEAISDTYAPESKICHQASLLAETLAELLKEFTEGL